jgi:hypothetical protein
LGAEALIGSDAFSVIKLFTFRRKTVVFEPLPRFLAAEI